MKKYFQYSFGVATILALASILIQSCADGKSEVLTIPKSTEAIPVKVMDIKSADESLSIISSGQITTDNEVILSFKIGGVVENIFVKDGDPVKKGQVLARLNQREISAILTQAKYAFEKAQRDLDRVTNLYRDSVVSLEQLQNSKTAFDVAQAQLENVKFNQTYSQIVAPSNGFVLKKFLNPGQVVGVGDPILKVNGAADGNWILKVNASDKQWANLQVGEDAQVTLDAFPGKSFNASVSRKSESADPQTGTFSVELQLKKLDVKLATGMFGSAKIALKNKSKVWSVPYESVLDANGKDGFVFVVGENMIALKQPVTISAIEKDRILISEGLANAHTLIISGSAYLADSTHITIIK
jgi:RND family efflux transporter MFP subunit